MTMDLHGQKLGFWKIFGVSWVIFRQQFKFILITLLGLYAVLTGIDALGRWFIPSEIYEHWALKGLHVSNLFGFIGSLAVIEIVRQSMKESTVDWKTLWLSVRPILLPSLLIRLLFIGGELAVDFPRQIALRVTSSRIIPSLVQLGMNLISMVLGIYFVFAYQTLCLKGQRGISALIYSFRAVTGSWWKLLGVRMISTLPIAALFLSMSLCDPTFALHVFIPITIHILYPIFAILSGYFIIFHTLFFLNIVQHDVRFSET